MAKQTAVHTLKAVAELAAAGTLEITLSSFGHRDSPTIVYDLCLRTGDGEVYEVQSDPDDGQTEAALRGAIMALLVQFRNEQPVNQTME